MLEEQPWLLEIKRWYIDYLCWVGCEAFTIVGFGLLQLQRTMFDLAMCTQDCKLCSCSDGFVGILDIVWNCEQVQLMELKYGCGDPEKPNVAAEIVIADLFFLKTLDSPLRMSKKFTFSGVFKTGDWPKVTEGWTLTAALNISNPNIASFPAKSRWKGYWFLNPMIRYTLDLMSKSKDSIK